MNSIPASEIVSILPAVIGTGGNPLALNALYITKNQPETMLGVMSFPNAEAVADVFGLTSIEYKAAQIYFSGFEGATSLPDTLYISSMVATSQAAKLIGAPVPTATASDFESLPDGFVIEIDGKSVPVAIESEVTSYSQLAQAVTTSMQSSGTCIYDANAKVFIVTGVTQGSTGSISYASGELASFMGLTEAKGAQKNNGISADTIADLMPRIYNQVSNFSTIMALENFSVSELVEISAWVTRQNSRFLHVIWRNGEISGDVTQLSEQILGAEMAGTLLFYGDYTHGAFATTYPASLNFDELNGRTNFTFRKQSGLTASVTSSAIAAQLRELGFNYYGAYATANDRFVFAYAGNVSGDFKWVDSYINQLYFNNQFQLALMTMLTSYKSIPYNDTGKAIHRAACQDVINQMANFGALQPGVELSELQKTKINLEAGFDAASQLNTQGWALLVGNTSAQTRGNRGSMPLKFWYADGGSVQSVNLPSVNVQ